MKLKITVIAIFCLALVAPIIGQAGQGRVRGRGFGGAHPMPQAQAKERLAEDTGLGVPFERLAEALELTPAQIESIQALHEAGRADREALAAQMQQTRENLQALIEQGTDPTAIGNAVLAQKALGEQARAAREQFKNDVRNLLTFDQQEKLDLLESLRGERGRRGRRGGPGR